MTPDKGLQDAAKIIQKGMEDNSKDSPQMSIDPDTQKMAVVGDPNQIETTNGDYTLTFLYSADEITEADKKTMKYREETDEYAAEIKYIGKRVKPLYRQKVDLLLADIFERMGVLDQTGFDTSKVQEQTSIALLDNIDKVAEIAYVVCGIPRDQVDHLDPLELANFLAQLLANEPNILKESVAFLAQRLQQRQGKNQEQAKKSSDTQQS